VNLFARGLRQQNDVDMLATIVLRTMVVI